jgi:hypothetical protein
LVLAIKFGLVTEQFKKQNADENFLANMKLRKKEDREDTLLRSITT